MALARVPAGIRSELGLFYSIVAIVLKWKSAIIHSDVKAIQASLMAILKKREIRRSVHQQGLIALDGGFARRKCVVTNISQSGARLTLDEASPLENRFKLSLNGDVRSGHACELMWQRGKSAGVRFIR